MPEIPMAHRLRDFQYHKVDNVTAGKMALVRAAYYQLAVMLVEGVPDSRERSLALTALEQLTKGVPLELVDDASVEYVKAWKTGKQALTAIKEALGQ